MNQSSDAGHFFQTDSSLSESTRKAEKSKNKFGNPIRLPSKLLAVIADPFNHGAVYVAEAAGTVKRVVLETGEISHTFRPSTSNPTPLTSLAISPYPSTSPKLFAGAWDKNIYVWPLPPSTTSNTPTTSSSTKTLTDHTDFVKCILALPPTSPTTPPLLISGSSDKSLIIWDANTLTKLHTLPNAHNRAVQALALDPLSIPDPSDPQGQSNQSLVVFTGDSNREIRAWRISSALAFEIPTADLAEQTKSTSDIAPLVVHETSIFGLAFGPSSGDLFTASADGFAKSLSRNRGFVEDTAFSHGDYVRCVAVSEARGVIVTGCRDEDVRVWDVASGKCVATLVGHWEEVCGVVVIGEREGVVVSVGIDGTVRRWGLGREELARHVEESEGEYEKVEEKKGESLLTEEEERELAELMDESD